jgi:peptidoglycan/LPS O-acetylase OafA/YrhL
MEKRISSLMTATRRMVDVSKRVEISYVPGKYVKEFDGWRGVGIIFVVLAHYFPKYLIGSWVFMEMFFVMSGFLITGILLDTKESKTTKTYFKSFILRRVVRVFPLYYLALVILLFMIPHTWLDTSYQKDHQWWYWLYIQNWLFSIEGWPPVKGLSHFWSLAIEEQFYIMWPFVIFLFSKKGLIRFCIFLFFFSLIFRNTGTEFGFVQPFQYVNTFARMEGIVLGALIAILVRTNKDLLERYTYPVTVIAGALSVGVFFYAGTMHMEYLYNYMINYTLVDIFFAGLIVMTLCKNELPGLKKIFNIGIIKQLGVMSYCIYIFHLPIQIISNHLFFDDFMAKTGSENLSKLICVGIAFVATIPVVYIIHKKVEVPLWKFKKYM